MERARWRGVADRSTCSAPMHLPQGSVLGSHFLHPYHYFNSAFPTLHLNGINLFNRNWVVFIIWLKQVAVGRFDE